MTGRDALGGHLRVVVDVAEEVCGDVSDQQMIAVWQSFHGAVRLLDMHLAAALPQVAAAGTHGCLVLAELARSTRRMLAMGDLADRVGVTSASMTQIVDRLATAGFVERRHETIDRRLVYATLTDAGSEEEQRSTPALAALVRREFSAVGSAGVYALAAICEQLHADLRSAQPHP